MDSIARFQVFVLGVFAFALVGCAVTPDPLTFQEIEAANNQDRIRARGEVPSIIEPLTLEACVARALKYNLNHRVTLFEAALAAGQLESSRFDMLPSLLVNAGYSWRDNDNTRVVGVNEALPSISRSRQTTDLTFYWSLLDFGLGYYTAQENANRSLIAVEKRRRAMNGLIKDVETAYWRAAASKVLRVRVQKALADAESALERSRIIVQAQLQPLKIALGYQRNLLENIRLLESVSEELALAEIELAGLINVAPGTDIPLKIPAELSASRLEASVSIVEQLALMHNPDLRIKHYEARVAVIETQRALWELVPNLSFNYGINTDDDKFLINNSWQSAGLSVGQNLFNLLSAGARMDVAEQGVALAEVRRMALQMTLLTQIHLALQQFQYANQRFERAREIYEVDALIAQQAERFAQEQMESELGRISTNVTAILSEVRLYHALARVKEAEIQIQSTVGVEPQIGNLDTISLAELQGYMATELRSDMLFSKNNPNQLDLPEPDRAFASNLARPAREVNYWIEMGQFLYRESAKSSADQLDVILADSGEWRRLNVNTLVRYDRGQYTVQAGPFDKDSVDLAVTVAERQLNQALQVREYQRP